MTQQDIKPNANAPLSERRHSDRPELWVTVILSSLVIHLFIFGMLRLWLAIRLGSFHASQILIPVDLIAIAPNASIQATQTTASSVTNPTGTINRLPNRQTSSVAIRADSQQVRSQTDTQSSSGFSDEFAQDETSPLSNPSPDRTGGTVTQPSTPDSSQNQQPRTEPNPPANQDTDNSGTPSTPNPTPSTPTGGTSGDSDASNPQQGGGFIGSLGDLALPSNDKDVLRLDEGDRLATPKQQNIELTSDDLKAIGISPDQAIELKVLIIIDNTGRATVYSPPQVVRGDISTTKAERLARRSIERVLFNPTIMAGEAVERAYYVPLTFNPSPS